MVVVDGDGAIGGYAQRGGAPGTRDDRSPRSAQHRRAVNAIFLTGGSAYGLSAGDGVTRYLEERKIGFKIAGTVVPIVPGAVLMDLGFGGSSNIRPTPTAAIARPQQPPMAPSLKETSVPVRARRSGSSATATGR